MMFVTSKGLRGTEFIHVCHLQGLVGLQSILTTHIQQRPFLLACLLVINISLS